MRLVEGGYLTNRFAGLTGRGAKFPPQFGQTKSSFVSTQSRQNVHSKVQIIASSESTGNSLLQHSQFGLISNILIPPFSFDFSFMSPLPRTGNHLCACAARYSHGFFSM
jgi:hypothetical protein